MIGSTTVADICVEGYFSDWVAARKAGQWVQDDVRRCNQIGRKTSGTDEARTTKYLKPVCVAYVSVAVAIYLDEVGDVKGHFIDLGVVEFCIAINLISDSTMGQEEDEDTHVRYPSAS